MKQTRKIIAMVLTLALTFSLFPLIGVSAASTKAKLNKTKVVIYVGKTVQLKVKNKNKTTKQKWATSNKKIATVTNKGKVKGKKAGSVVITVKIGKKRYKCKVIVKRKVNSKYNEQTTINSNELPTTKQTEQQTTKQTEQQTANSVEQTTTNSNENMTEGVEESNSDWKYLITDKNITLLRYIGEDTNVVIPSVIKGKPVTNISYELFGDFDEGMSYSDVISITIPESVKDIDSTAFVALGVLNINFINNSSLDADDANYWGAKICDKEVNGLYISGTTVIKPASRDITEVIIPQGITDIGVAAFAYCEKMISVSIPEGVTNIGGGAFLNCNSLKEVSIPEGVTNIGYITFCRCSNLERVVIPKTITYIDNEAFYETYILKSGFVNNSSLNPEQFGRWGYWGARLYDEITNGMYILSNKVIGVVDKESKELIIPDTVTRIGSYAFSGWSGYSDLENITIPESVTSIDDYAFYECSKLKKIEIPKSVTRIGESAFYGCTGLDSVTIPANVTYIGNTAFKECYLINLIDNSEINKNPDGPVIISPIQTKYWGATICDEKINEMAIVNNEVVKALNKDAITFVIPDTVTKVKEYAFSIAHVCAPEPDLPFTPFKL